MRSNIQKNKTQFSTSFIEQGRKNLSDHFAGVSVQLDGPICVRDYSEIFHALIDTTEPLEAAVKHCLVPHTRNPDILAAKEQFAALERVNSALTKGNARYRVPTPLFLDTERATFAMSWVEGESLTGKMRRPGVFIKGPAWFEDVGAWLGNFHNAGPIQRKIADLDERLAVIDYLHASPLPDKSFAKALLILRETTTTVSDIEVAITWLHGDCKTDNFILSGNTIYGIDISLSHENPVEYDISNFMNKLALLCSSPQNLYLLGMQNSFEKAFWRGYLSTGPSVSLVYLNWLRLNFLLSFWHAMLNEQRQTIRTRILNRMFSKLADRLSTELF